MSDNSYGVNLYDAEDVLPLGLAGTPWEIIFKALRDVLKSGVDASDSGFMRKACALYYLSRGDLEVVTDRDVLNGIAAALAIPYWVENFDDPAQASAIIYHWLKYKPTRANLTALALASGMRAFRLREIYTTSEYGISHSFGFDLGDDYAISFFAGPDAEPGNTTAQRICGALTHFFLRIKDSPTLITDITYPDAPPSGWQYFFRSDQSVIRILQGYRWDLFEADGNLAYTPDEYAVINPTVIRDKFGSNTTVSSLSEVLILDNGQLKLAWGQAPADAYCLYASVTINIPGMVPAWPLLSHADVNIPPNTIPGYALYTTDGVQITGSNWSIFAAYDSDLNRIDASDLYLAGTSPVRLRSRRYVRLNQVWLVPPFIAGGTVSANSEHIIYSMLMTGLVVPGGYTYPDGALLGMNWDFGGVVEEYSPVQQIDLILALRYSQPSGPFLSKTFSANDWWWSGIISQQEADNITAFGLNIVTQSDSSKWFCGPYGGLDYDPEYDYDLLELYSDMGETPVTFDSSNFYLGANDYPNYQSYPNVLLIHAISAFSTSTMTYKIRATKGGNRNQVMYLAQDRSVVNGNMSDWYPLYRRDGVVVQYTGSLPVYLGYFSTETTYNLETTDRGFSFRNNNGILEVSASWGFTANRIVVKWPYVIAYKQDGTTAICYKGNDNVSDLYTIPSASLANKTEAQLNALGWYV